MKPVKAVRYYLDSKLRLVGKNCGLLVENLIDSRNNDALTFSTREETAKARKQSNSECTYTRTFTTPMNENGPRGRLKPLKELDNLISKELLKLSYHDRNAINEEIHGVRCLAVEETPDLLRTSLNALQRQIDAISPTKKGTYSEILQLKQQQQQQHRWRQLNQVISEATAVVDAVPYSFIDDENFRLRFLRCEFFDAEKAAIRFVNYLNISYELFGSVALKRPVRISDLSKAEVRFARKGYLQILPYRDRAGRCVVVLLGGMSSDVDPFERVRFISNKQFFVIGEESIFS